MSRPFDPRSLHAEFRDEARDQLNVLDAALGAVESSGTLGDAERAELARALHTLKGNAGMLGFNPLSSFVHDLEEILAKPPGAWADRIPALVRAAAALRSAAVAAGTEDEDRAFAALKDVRLERAGEPAPTPPGERPRDEGAPEDEPSGERIVASSRADEVVRVPFAKLDALLAGVGDLISATAALRTLLDENRKGLEECGTRRPLEAHVARSDVIIDELRRTVMDLRLVPVGQLLSRFPSLAKDLAVRAGKSVRVEVEGEETELDKSTLDALAEPLLHLVRNAVAHGIEGPDERALAGKAAYGTITLRARREGEKVRIDVEDDGRGLDLAAIEREVRDRGWIGEAGPPSRRELTEWILRPEFTTLDTAGEEAGRGVGLHAVRRAVTELHGALVVEPLQPGTRFSIALPLRVMIVPSVIFDTAGETLALPAADVIEAVRRGDHGEEVSGLVRLDGMTVPLRPLSAAFGSDAAEDGKYLVVTHGPGGPIAIPATDLHEQQNLVVRGIPPYLGSIEGISGAAVMPSGAVVLLLDPTHLPSLSRAAPRGGR